MILDLSEIPRRFPISTFVRTALKPFYLMNLTLRSLFSSLLLTAIFLAETQRPNIVVFISDDLGRLDTSIHGSKDARTPTMDLLATRGMTFDDASRCLAILLPEPLLLAYRLDARPSRRSPQP